MPDITKLSILVDASVEKALSSLNRLSGALSNVETGTKKTESSTKASTKATKSSADAVGNLAKQYRSMGLARVGKQFIAIQKAANLAKGATKSVSDAMSVADEFQRKGQTTIAQSIRTLGANPMASESALKAEEERTKERAAFAKQAAKERAAAEQRARKLSSESERAYTRIVNEEAKKRTAALREAAKVAAEKEKEAARDAAAAEKQAKREQIIGAKALARARAIAAKEAEKAEKQAAREAAKAAREAEKAAREQARQAEKQAAEEQRQSERRKKAALESLGLIGKSEAPFKKIKAFLKAIGRIAVYRAIRTAIKSISAAVREGLTNLEAYSREVGTAFAPAVDNLRRHVLWLKNAFATALRPVIEALIPVIQRLVDWLVKAADFVAQVMSVLTGKVDNEGRYTKAVLTDLQQSNKQAKELRRTLLGFDEINRLDGDTGSGETSSTGLAFTQADVSDEAVVAAGKIKEIFEKIKDFAANTDWETVLKVFTAFLALRGVIKFVTAIKRAWDFLRGIGSAISSIAHSIGLVGGVVAAIIVVFALWGDKISNWLAKAKKKVDDFFNGLKSNGRMEWNSVVTLVKDIIDLVMNTVGLIASIVYKLFHGDFKGAFDDFIRLLGTLVKGVVNIVGGVINIILGLVSDIVNGIIKGVLFIYNEGIVPVVNWVRTAIENIKIFFHNFGVDLKIGFWTAVKAIIDAVNWALSKVEGAINSAIDLYNEITGSKMQPVRLQIDSTNVDNKIEELKGTKLEPITETIQFLPKVEQPKPLDLRLNLDGANRGIDNLVNKIIGIQNRLASVSGALGASGIKSFATITNYASGGFPAVGTLFIAGERGAEYVTNINGRTGVYNTDQMATALYNAMVAALSTMPSQGGGDIYLDGEKIYASVVRRNNNHVRSTGRAALLT